MRPRLPDRYRHPLKKRVAERCHDRAAAGQRPRLIATRLSIEFIDEVGYGRRLIAMSFPFLYIGFGLACGLFVVALEWPCG